MSAGFLAQQPRPSPARRLPLARVSVHAAVALGTAAVAPPSAQAAGERRLRAALLADAEEEAAAVDPCYPLVRAVRRARRARRRSVRRRCARVRRAPTISLAGRCP